LRIDDQSMQERSSVASQLMETAIEINEYRSQFAKEAGALQYWEDMKLFVTEIEKIRGLFPELNSQETTLERAKSILIDFRRIFGDNFKSFHLLIFERIGGEGKELVSFLLEQNFQTGITSLTGQLKTHQTRLSVLTDILQVCFYLNDGRLSLQTNSIPPLAPRFF